MTSVATQNTDIAFISKHKEHLRNYAANIGLYEQGNPERARLEVFISDIFRKFYQAEIHQFYPALIAIESDIDDTSQKSSAINAVAGVRCAAEEPLFSEFYLQNSLESELENIYKQPVSRSTTVEVGNLAPAHVGQMRWLIAAINGFLYSAGFKHIVFTAVPNVYNAFKRMNLPLDILIQAKKACLPEDIRDKWGDDYYDLKPVVLSGDISKGYHILKNNIYTENQKLIPLFEKACELGRQFQLKRDVA